MLALCTKRLKKIKPHFLHSGRSNRQSAPLPQVIVELVQTTLEQFAAFKGWRLYFPTEGYGCIA